MMYEVIKRLNEEAVEKEPDVVKNLLDLIPGGEENGVSMKLLATYLRTYKRSVRLLVERARCKGCVIASGDAGYYIPETPEELRAYIGRATARIRTGEASLRSARSLLEEYGEAE